MSRLVVISPHLDDAVFSCGTLIHASTVAKERPLVVTVCAGIPGDGVAANLDVAAGFASSRDAMTVRRNEDVNACAILGAEALHLDVLDAQYAGDVAPEHRIAEMRDAIDAALLRHRERHTVAPVGIRHIDHQHVAAACDDLAAVWYEELPYRVLWPDIAEAALAAAGFTAPVWLTLPSCPAKARAVRRYTSQIGDGDPGPELAAEERYNFRT